MQRRPGLLRYAIEVEGELFSGIELGASVAIHGVCQTVVSVQGSVVELEAIRETLLVTTLDLLQVGQRVHVERSLRMGDEIGGHLLSGHVYGMAEVVHLEPLDGEICMQLSCPKEWMRYILPKGFVALDGVSLTVGKTFCEGGFDVHLIPETARRTTLCQHQKGDRLNLELDSRTQAIVDTCERYLSKS